jgi:transposase
LLDLPLYSPVPGLTEEAFAKCKALLRQVAATKEAFGTTIRELRI